MGIDVRRAQAGDGPLLKEVRLAALLDAPDAFARDHDEEAAEPDDFWAQTAGTNSSGPDHTTFFGFVDGTAVGIVGGHRVDEAEIELVAMWTRPEHRGAGIGERLVEAVVEWADGDRVRPLGHPGQRSRPAALRAVQVRGDRGDPAPSVGSVPRRGAYEPAGSLTARCAW